MGWCIVVKWVAKAGETTGAVGAKGQVGAARQKGCRGGVGGHV